MVCWIFFQSFSPRLRGVGPQAQSPPYRCVPSPDVLLFLPCREHAPVPAARELSANRLSEFPRYGIFSSNCGYLLRHLFLFFGLTECSAFPSCQERDNGFLHGAPPRLFLLRDRRLPPLLRFRACVCNFRPLSLSPSCFNDSRLPLVRSRPIVS